MPNTGITFSETMSGRVVPGETDYLKGMQRLDGSGHSLAMHARVRIDDLSRFIEDPTHAGQLEGSIDYPPFGEHIPSHSGRFNLFSPTDDPDTKFIIYELGFEHQGQAYYLAGHKAVRNDTGPDLWSDTTSLYTRLHKGNDTQGQVVAAGMLHLGGAELLKLVASMKVTGTDSFTVKADTLLRFGRFFLGELWDSYANGLGNH
jgi:cholesterol oxidase